jgi:transmembrane sensor
VLTTEGKVRVVDESAPALAPARETDLTAGHRTSVPLTIVPATPAPLAVSAVSPTDIAQELAWWQMRFELSNATLEQAVAWFNARSTAQFVVGDAELRELRLSGIYWVDNPAQFAELVATSLDLNVVHENAGSIVFRRK